MDNSGLNTVLLLVIAGALVLSAVWYFTTQVENEPEASIELTLPDRNNE